LGKIFTQSKRQTLNVCPGVRLRFSWQLAKAERLDSREAFLTEIREKIDEVLSAWRQSLPNREDA